jgi:chitodextrinase
MKQIITTVLLIMCSISFSQNVNPLWKISSRISNSKSINKTELPSQHLFDLDVKTLKSALASSPKRDFSKTKSNSIISLPNGDGKLEKFRVFENSVMDPALSAKYPEIKSYVAVGIDNPTARAYFSNSPLGFKAMTLYADESAVFIEPISSDSKTYTVYKRSDKKASLDAFECNTIDQAVKSTMSTTSSMTARFAADDGKLRTFRLALSCTAEYAAFFGGYKSQALAGMNNTLTRINGIFEKDFGAQLILIANNDMVIYTNATTDPYSDSTSKSNWRSELKSNLNSTIGLANYDIGHLLGANSINVNSGDAGCIGCICSDFNKGSGYTTASPTNFSGDSFDIDFVAHEMGHQLGANHTYSYVTESASGAQIEPGSGSTIMSYAGSTSKDVQNYSDAYFHAITIQQVTDNIKNKTCATLVTTGNTVPVVNAGLDYNIPKGTPFMLTGSGTDANADDVLTYTWEEMDLGNATTTVPSISATTGPLFRSYAPSASPIRYFPNMTTVLAGAVTTSGVEIPVEVLPGVARILNFRLTVRDNRAGGSANNTDDMMINVDGNSGPFTVDSQNSAISYAAGTTQTINWTVAGTDANGVNCATVDILLSTDGGNSFPISLLSANPNNGVASIVIPNIPGTVNRIMVKGTNQIFFDVNNANFTITSSAAADTTAPTASTLSASGTTTSITNLSWTAATDNIGVTAYTVYQNGVLKTTTTVTFLAVTGLTASNAYSFYVVAKDAAGNLSLASNMANITTLALADITAPTASTLSASGTTTSSTNLYWTAATDNVGVTGYNVYQNGVLKTTTTATSLAANGLTASTAYPFYVVAKDAAGNLSGFSNIINVTTLTPADTTSPTTSTLSASGTTTSSTNLSWTEATNNVGVTGYDVYQNSILKTTTTATYLAVAGFTSSTAYSFYVVAKDAAGNLSGFSNIINVTTLTPADTTSPTTSTLSTSGTNTSSTTLSWTAATDNAGVTGYKVYQNGLLKTTTTVPSLTVTGLNASTVYSFFVVATDAAGNLSASSNIANVNTLANTSVAYCSSYGTSTTKEHIKNVQIGSINNVSNDDNGYGNFTTLFTNLVTGTANSLFISPAWTSRSSSTEYYNVWIDFNQDGDFDDSDELVFSKSKTKAKTVSGSVVIPTNALSGSTRMRIAMKNNALPNPCEIFANGEVEDYTVSITSGGTAKMANTNEVTAVIETTNTLEVAKLSFKLYPNPVKGDILNISNIEVPSDFRIFNLMGQELERKHVENNEIYVGSLQAGVYIIEVTDGISTTTKKFIKE